MNPKGKPWSGELDLLVGSETIRGVKVFDTLHTLLVESEAIRGSMEVKIA